MTAEGGWREVSLLRSQVGDQAIRDVIERTEARGLSPQRIRFWQLVLGLPARRADGWVRRAQESTWARRTRRHRRSVDFDWFREGVEDAGHVLVALAYFDDADRERTPMLLQRQAWSDVKATIRGWLAGATRGRR